MENKDYSNILVTGGSGLLGQTLKPLLKHAWFPTHKELDICKYWQIPWYISTGNRKIDTIVHLAAFTSPPRVDEDPQEAIVTNIMGTANIVNTCINLNLYLIYMSTDYVFDGESIFMESNGDIYTSYKEESLLHPINKYAWSKLGGECAVRMYDNSLIIRTSFGPDEFPYEKAFVDQYTSRESVTNIAHKLVRIIDHKPNITGVLHIGGKRQTVFEYAKQTKPNVKELKRNEVNFMVPHDTSLDSSKYKEIFGE